VLDVTASRAIRVAAPTIGNSVPDFVKLADSFNVFKRRLKFHVSKQPSFPTGVSVSQSHKQRLTVPQINNIALYCTVLYNRQNAYFM